VRSQSPTFVGQATACQYSQLPKNGHDGRTVAVCACQAYTEFMAVKEDRLAFRMTAEQKGVIKRAAELSGRDVTEFAVQVLTERAEAILAEQRVFGANRRQWNDFIDLLDQPARPVAELVDLLQRPTVFEE